MPLSGAPEERGCESGFTLYNLVDNCAFRVVTEDQRRAAVRAFDQALGSLRKFSIAWYWPGAKRPRRSAVRATSHYVASASKVIPSAARLVSICGKMP